MLLIPGTPGPARGCQVAENPSWGLIDGFSLCHRVLTDFLCVCARAFLIFDRADKSLEDGLFWGADQAEIQCDPERNQERFTGLLHRQIFVCKAAARQDAKGVEGEASRWAGNI